MPHPVRITLPAIEAADTAPPLSPVALTGALQGTQRAEETWALLRHTAPLPVGCWPAVFRYAALDEGLIHLGAGAVVWSALRDALQTPSDRAWSDAHIRVLVRWAVAQAPALRRGTPTGEAGPIADAPGAALYAVTMARRLSALGSAEWQAWMETLARHAAAATMLSGPGESRWHLQALLQAVELTPPVARVLADYFVRGAFRDRHPAEALTAASELRALLAPGSEVHRVALATFLPDPVHDRSDRYHLGAEWQRLVVEVGATALKAGYDEVAERVGQLLPSCHRQDMPTIRQGLRSGVPSAQAAFVRGLAAARVPTADLLATVGDLGTAHRGLTLPYETLAPLLAHPDAAVREAIMLRLGANPPQRRLL